MSDAPAAPTETPAKPLEAELPEVGGPLASTGPTGIVLEPLPLYRNPKKKAEGWVDPALAVISQMRARDKSQSWNHGRANQDIISAVIERRNAGNRRLDAHELEHIKIACEDAQKHLGLSDQSVNPLDEIARLFGQLTDGERRAVGDAMSRGANPGPLKLG